MPSASDPTQPASDPLGNSEIDPAANPAANRSGRGAETSAGVPHPWHAHPPGDAAGRLRTDLARGLNPEAVEEIRAAHGPNELEEPPGESLARKFLRQFGDFVVWMLIVAAVISGVMGDEIEAGAIIAIVLLNAVLGFVQEERAGRALAGLRKLAPPMAKATRGGELVMLEARELVPGDVIHLEAGDRIPADSRLIDHSSFHAQESALTGESLPSAKNPHARLEPDTPIAERTTMVFMGAVATGGKARAIVTATGMNAELGAIARMLGRHEPEPAPLQKRLAQLGRSLALGCMGIVAVVFALQLWQAVRAGEPLLDAAGEVFLLAVSLAVAAVPEGLPAVVTVALAIGLQRMVRRNALVRRLPSVETLGSVTVICSDKTGTLTRNEMTVRRVIVGAREFEVGGAGFNPEGEFCEGGSPVDRELIRVRIGPPAVAEGDPAFRDLALMLAAGAICNSATLRSRGDSPGSWEALGDPTEAALLAVAAKAGLGMRDGAGGIFGGAAANAAGATGVEDKSTNELVFENPFDSDRKRMSVVTRGTGSGADAGGDVMYAKGAPEAILEVCDRERIDGADRELTAESRARILERSASLAGEALRTLAVAYRPDPDHEYAERGLIFLGLAAMRDPPRAEALEAIERCHRAGIRTVMITGDHPLTAGAIARELGLDPRDGDVVSGRDLEAMSDPELVERVAHASVFARVTAEHKLRIVRALRARGEIAAMTGDGANDAPALQEAEIGIAMGITGSDVTKGAADMVLTDDNFATIVNAVEEGRCIYDNIRKFVGFLLACNGGEILFIFISSLLGWPTPLKAIHLLWINLVTDGAPALALGLERPEPDIMSRPPRPPSEPLIPRGRALRLLAESCLIAAASLAAFALAYFYRPERDLDHGRAVAFCVMSFSQLCLAFGSRSHRYTMPQLGFLTNPALLGAIAISALIQMAAVGLPFLRPIFGVTTPLLPEWPLILGLSLAPVTVVEVAKLVRAAWRGREGCVSAA